VSEILTFDLTDPNDAVAIVEAQRQRIRELEAQLATARRDAMEECAGRLDEIRRVGDNYKPEELSAWDIGWIDGLREGSRSLRDKLGGEK